jgi:magnesium chelatase family protein
LIALDALVDDLSEWFVFGELGLDGAIKENLQLYALLLSLSNQKIIKKAVVPYESLEKLSNIPNVDFYGVKTLDKPLHLKNSANADKCCL